MEAIAVTGTSWPRQAGPTPWVRIHRDSQRFGAVKRADSGRVLVLNASYEPLNRSGQCRARPEGKAEMLEHGRTLHAESITFPHPVVIRLITYVRRPA